MIEVNPSMTRVSSQHNCSHHISAINQRHTWRERVRAREGIASIAIYGWKITQKNDELLSVYKMFLKEISDEGAETKVYERAWKIIGMEHREKNTFSSFIHKIQESSQFCIFFSLLLLLMEIARNFRANEYRQQMMIISPFVSRQGNNTSSLSLSLSRIDDDEIIHTEISLNLPSSSHPWEMKRALTQHTTWNEWKSKFHSQKLYFTTSKWTLAFFFFLWMKLKTLRL